MHRKITGRRCMAGLVLLLLFASPVGGCGKKSAVSFPPVDTQCRSDDDCTYDTHYLQPTGKDLRCCRSCSGKAVSASWAAKVESICITLGSDDCPMKKCKAFPPVACVKGSCSAVPEP